MKQRSLFRPGIIALVVMLGGVVIWYLLKHGDRATDPADVVIIETGRISGVTLDMETGLQVYRGIPYAVPPVGALRWRSPQPARAWEGVLSQDTFGAACPQQLREGSTVQTSEDCLYLNVWTTRAGTEAKLPVMVWIHGGGLNRGYAHQPVYDGSEFAGRGIVLVTINYRLGPFGFLAHPDLSDDSEHGVSGNYGFLDQIAALEWTQRNIVAFGGDPDNVTVFGESAGGTSVSVLCASPLASGLFHRAIIQSPWMFGFITDMVSPNFVYLNHGVSNAGSAESLGIVWVQRNGTGDEEITIETLRNIPAAAIMEGAPYYETRATIDGWLLPTHPANVFEEGQQLDVPVLIGTTADEGNYFRPFFSFPQRSDFENTLNDYYGIRGDDLLSLYPGASEEQLRVTAGRFVTDAWFVQPAVQLLRGMENVASAAYQYQFTRSNDTNPALGSTHAVELPYVFNTLAGETVKPEDRRLASTMMDYWIEFARTGNPNKDGLPHWPEYSRTAEQYLKIGERILTDSRLCGIECETLNRVAPAYTQ